MLNIHSPDYVSMVLVSIFVLRNLGICAISRLHCTFSESGSCMPISRLHTRFMQSWRVCSTSAQSQDHAIYIACTTEPTLSFEFPSYMYSVKVRNICKKLLQLRCHHQCRACTQASCTRLPSPRSWYRHRVTPRPVSAPVQDFTNSESSQLSSISQLTLAPLVRYVCELHSRLTSILQILRMRSATSRSHKFLDCMEHIHKQTHLNTISAL